jgi:prepilin-type N-terminal cleavage/methylation domain-containing protein
MLPLNRENKSEGKTGTHRLGGSAYPSLVGGKGFSLVELLIVVAIVAILGAVSFVAIQNTKSRALNERMTADLVAIANALEDFRRDHQGAFPVPVPRSNQNVLCFDAAGAYTHDCAGANFVQGMIDNELLTKRYLREVPTDPRTGSRYAYGVTGNGKYYMVAGNYDNGGDFEARTVENLAKGFLLPSLIRAYDGPGFVTDGGANLPYPSDPRTVTGTLANIADGADVKVDGDLAGNGTVVRQGETIVTGPATTGTADLYLSDGSTVRLDPGTELTLESLKSDRNDKSGTVTRILLDLKLGKIWAKVARLAASSEFNVRTTSAIAGVRGTEFGIELDGTGKEGTVFVRSGIVDVSSAANPAAPTAIDNGSGGGILPAAPRRLTFAQDSVGTVAETLTDPLEIRALDSHFASPLTTQAVPFVVGSLQDFSCNHTFHISFNGPTVAAGTVAVAGIELFGSHQMAAPRTPRKGVLEKGQKLMDIPADGGSVTYDGTRQAWAATFNYCDDRLKVHEGGDKAVLDSMRRFGLSEGQAAPLLVRAYSGTGGSRTFTALSWPPISLSADSATLASFTGKPHESDFSGIVLEGLKAPQAAALAIDVDDGISIPADGAAQARTVLLKGEGAAGVKGFTLSVSGACSALDKTVTFASAGSCMLTAVATRADNTTVTLAKTVAVTDATRQLAAETPIVRWVPDPAPGRWEATVKWTTGNAAAPGLSLAVTGPGAYSCAVSPATGGSATFPNAGCQAPLAPGAYVATLEMGAERVAKGFDIQSGAAVTADFIVRKGADILGDPASVDLTGETELSLRAPDPVDTALYTYRWAGAESDVATQEEATLALVPPGTPGQSVTRTVTLTIRKKADAGLGDLVATRTRTVAARRVVKVKSVAFSSEGQTATSASLYTPGLASPATIGLADRYPVKVVSAEGIDPLPDLAVACDYAVETAKAEIVDGSTFRPKAFGTIPIECAPRGLPAGYVLEPATLAANLSMNVTGCGDGNAETDIPAGTRNNSAAYAEECDDGNAVGLDACDSSCHETGITFYADYADEVTGDVQSDFRKSTTGCVAKMNDTEVAGQAELELFDGVDGLKVPAGEKNYLECPAKDNLVPANGAIEIGLRKTELLSAGYAYLLDIVDDGGRHVEIYKTELGKLYLKIGTGAGNYFPSLNLTSLNENIILKASLADKGLSIRNADGIGAPVVAFNAAGTPPTLSFANPSSLFYVGSKAGGAVSTGTTTLGQPLQYTGYIRFVKLFQ